MATIQATMNNLPSILHDSALAWAKAYYQTDQVVVAIILEEGDEPDRYLALIAAANQAGWQAAEVWLEDGRVVAINDLGEGIPPDGAPGPGSEGQPPLPGCSASNGCPGANGRSCNHLRAAAFDTAPITDGRLAAHLPSAPIQYLPSEQSLSPLNGGQPDPPRQPATTPAPAADTRPTRRSSDTARASKPPRLRLPPQPLSRQRSVARISPPE